MKLEFSLQGFFPVVGDAVEQLVEPSAEIADRYLLARVGRESDHLELANVSPHGFWLLIDDREHYLPFDAFPWFRDATIGQLSRVEGPTREHLHWPDLDVELTMDSIERPDAYPLVSRAPSNRT